MRIGCVTSTVPLVGRVQATPGGIERSLPPGSLDADEAPELVLEPVEVLLCAFLRAVVGPARALERIEPQVGQVRDVGPGLVTHPATRLVDEAVLVVADADGAELAFAEVPDLGTVRRALAGDQVHLVVTVEIDLVGAVAELLALLELLA